MTSSTVARPLSMSKVRIGILGSRFQAALYAAYASAGVGRKVTLAFRPKDIAKPIDLWKAPERARAVV